MKSKWLAGLLFGVLSLVFVTYLVGSVAGLPEPVASHFNWRGQPDDWMSRSNYLLVFGLIGLGIPLLIIGLFFAVRFFPARTIKLPRRDYWLAPERRERTFDFLLRYGLWQACLLVLFLIAVHYLVVQANSRTPVALPRGSGIVIGLYVAAVASWLAAFYLHFAKGSKTA